MSVRIKIGDLSAEGREHKAVYLLHLEIKGRFQSEALLEGDTVLGSGAACDIRIEAAGVRARHVRIKRRKDEIHVIGVKGAHLVIDGKVLEGLVALPLGQAFHFGSVQASVERQLPQDRLAGVRVGDSDRSAAASRQRSTKPISLSKELETLSTGLEKALSSQEFGIEYLLEALNDSFSPVHLILHQSLQDGERVLLGEMGIPASEDAASNPIEHGYSRYRYPEDEPSLILEILFSESEPDSLKDAFCKQILLILHLGLSRVGSKAQRKSKVNRIQDPWNEFVGSEVRSSLGKATDLCYHSNSVLVIGETGTGKELVARALHRLWARKGEFVALNCAAIPGELLEAELFGTEAGMATGVSARQGRIRQAENGTLFLDEISSLPMSMQSKLLRVLQEREYYTLGGSKLLKANLNIVAAANQVLEELRAGKLMRQDLFFRLAQATVHLPPLRDRTADLPSLCRHLLVQMEEQYQRNVTGISVSALKAMKHHQWSGNIRELQNLLRQLYFSAPPGELIQRLLLPEIFQVIIPESTRAGSLATMVRSMEKQVIERELNNHKNVSEVAKSLGLSEGYLYRKIKKLGISAKT
jgi:DNA-binding NtrC family response regulator